MGTVLLVRQPAQSEPVELDGVEAVYGVGTGTQSRLWAAGRDCGSGRVAVLDANGCLHPARTGVDSGASRIDVDRVEATGAIDYKIRFLEGY